MRMANKKALNVQRKNRRKAIRTIIQVLILGAVAWWLVNELTTIQTYREPDRTAWSQQEGFIALSYFGVGRTGTAKLADDDVIAEHLQALKRIGYETISQQDILDFYQKNKPLPERALYLAFEDGRRDSTLYVQPVLERLNYRATIMTYAQNIIHHERKFLRDRDLLKLLESGYWEIGSNGNRLTYINIYDRFGRFLGMREDTELKKENIADIAYYNHYLMDFLRDENMIPVENREEMWQRIDEDYAKLAENYQRTIGTIPNAYMIMHANSIYNGMNRLVEEVNVRNIERIFDIHFNREGQAFNGADDHRYNLTRLQVAPYWSTNHLLMKLQQDTGQAMAFVIGDEDRAKSWDIVNGAAQFADDRIVLTSPPQEEGIMILRGSEDMTDYRLNVNLTGNVVGEQTIRVRYDRDAETYIAIKLRDNRLKIEEKTAGGLVEHYEGPLSEVEIAAEDIAFDKASVYTREQTSSGADALYEHGQYPVNIRQTRALEIILQEERLSVLVDGELVVEDLKIAQGAGTVALLSQYSEQNEKDQIYDAMFEKLEIVGYASNTDHEALTSLYSNRLTGWKAWRARLSNIIDSVIDWSIDVF